MTCMDISKGMTAQRFLGGLSSIRTQTYVKAPDFSFDSKGNRVAKLVELACGELN
jgi:hypothetical protein